MVCVNSGFEPGACGAARSDREAERREAMKGPQAFPRILRATTPHPQDHQGVGIPKLAGIERLRLRADVAIIARLARALARERDVPVSPYSSLREFDAALLPASVIVRCVRPMPEVVGTPPVTTPAFEIATAPTPPIVLG